MAPLVVIRSGSKYVEYRESRAEWMRMQQLKIHDSAAESRANSSSFMGFGSSRGDVDARARADYGNQEEEQQEQEEQAVHGYRDEQEDAHLLQLEQQPQQRRSRHVFRKPDSDEFHGDEERRSSICGLPLGLSTDLHAQDGMRGFNCADCGNMVADRDDVVAKTFFGRTGKAFLMNNMYVRTAKCMYYVQQMLCSFGADGIAIVVVCRFNIHTGAPRNRYLMTGMHTISDVCCNICDSVLGWKYVSELFFKRYKGYKASLESHASSYYSCLILLTFAAVDGQVKAMETSQKYKEGKFILEKALVQDDSEEKAWQRH